MKIFLLPFLLGATIVSFAYADQKECGIKKTTIEERLKDCASLPGSSKVSKSGVSWNLVARGRKEKTGSFYEVWKDSRSGLLWSDRLDSFYSHDNFFPHNGLDYAVILDKKDGKVIGEKACASKEARTATAEISEKKFALPTVEEFVQAETNGVREVLPNMKNYWFWSTSLYPHSADGARAYFGSYGLLIYGIRHDDFYSVRCVAH